MLNKFISRFRRRPSTTRSGELGPWTEAALHAMGQACALGLVIPPYFLPTRRDEDR